MPLGHNKKPSKCISNVRVSRKSVRQTNTEPPTAVKLLAKSESETKTSKESKSKPQIQSSKLPTAVRYQLQFGVNPGCKSPTRDESNRRN